MAMTIRPLRERDLREADRICRLAFGTFLGLPDPMSFMGDASYVETRWRADPAAAIAAELDGELVGSNFATRWGSFGFFGPLTVRPDLWDHGVARRLLEATMEIFSGWKTRHEGLFTFAQSAKHVALYQKFGFWPRFLTAVMSKPVERPTSETAAIRFSKHPERAAALNACGRLTDEIFPGLDVSREIHAIEEQRLGETLLLEERGSIAGVAVCHLGPGSEAGSDTCYVKFGAARPGIEAEERFGRLLHASELLASDEGAASVVAGVNLARTRAYRMLVDRGYRTVLQGVAMQRPNEPAFNVPDSFVIDDWR